MAERAALPAEAVREQLDRITSSAPFRNSRRCQSLLVYVVKKSLDGHVDELRERVVGTRVFGRDPDYDTNQDAVVRNAAAEVRKRLAQYYLETGRDDQLRIELPAGSYVPEFHVHTTAERIQTTSRGHAWIRRAAVLVFAGAVLAGVLAIRPWWQPVSDLDRFWQPVVDAPGVVQMCIGQTSYAYYPGKLTGPDGARLLPDKIDTAALLPMRDRFLHFGDAVCLAKLSGYLQTKGKETLVRGAHITHYSELRRKPLVLIGAFNNQWTMRLQEGLRFTLANLDNRTWAVVDHQDANNKAWTVLHETLNVGVDQDYAIITRVFDPTMERWVVAVGGITTYGTQAGGEFVSNQAYFTQALRNAPTGWNRKNLQVVIQTKVVGDTTGPPQVLATHFW